VGEELAHFTFESFHCPPAFVPLAGITSLPGSEADVCFMPLLLDRLVPLARLALLPEAGVLIPIFDPPEPLLDEGILPLPEAGIRPSPPEDVVELLPPKGDIPPGPAEGDPPLRLELELLPIPPDDPNPGPAPILEGWPEPKPLVPALLVLVPLVPMPLVLVPLVPALLMLVPLVPVPLAIWVLWGLLFQFFV